MVKSATILVSSLCLVSLLAFAYAHEDRFFVEGKVYCDTCRAQFYTKLSTPIKGAKVRLECKDVEGGQVTYSSEALTDASSIYHLPVDGDHQDEVCEVALVSSPQPDCAEIVKEPFHKLSARISLTGNNGLVTPVRQANPLGFLRKEILPGCAEVMKELGFTKDGSLA